MREVALVETRHLPLPFGIKGFTIPSPDGCFNIYINNRLSYEEQKVTYDHEVDHIMNGDFDKDLPGSVLK